MRVKLHTGRGHPSSLALATTSALSEKTFTMPAIETDSPEAIWLYRIAQTAFAEAGRVMVFANGHLPYRGDARFDLNYWNFANYSLTGV